MQNEFWLNKWKNNEIKFHLPEVNSILIKYAHLLPKGQILVPLCGKSIDMLWLLSNGYYVIGVELSSIACEAFFQENNIAFIVEDKSPYTIYKGDNIQIWCGDIFQLPLEAVSGLTAIYDRAALVALPQDMRKLYAQYIQSIAQASLNSINILLLTVEYDQNLLDGPPFSVTQTMVEELYSSVFIIKELSLEYANLFQDNPRFNEVNLQDHVYLLNSHLA